MSIPMQIQCVNEYTEYLLPWVDNKITMTLICTDNHAKQRNILNWAVVWYEDTVLTG